MQVQSEAPLYKKKYLNLVFSGKNQAAQTPPWLWELIRESAWSAGAEVFDPCPPRHTVDGLKRNWGPRTIVNPPYANIPDWLEKAEREHAVRGVQSVFIIPFRPARRYFQEYAQRASGLYVLSRRVAFVGYTRPFPTAICLMCFGCKLDLGVWRGAEFQDHTVKALYKSFPRSSDYKSELESYLREHYGGTGRYKTVLGSAKEAFDVTRDGLLLMLPVVQTDYFMRDVLEKKRLTSVVLLTPVLVMEGFTSRSLLGSIMVGLGRKRVKTEGHHELTFLW